MSFPLFLPTGRTNCEDLSTLLEDRPKPIATVVVPVRTVSEANTRGHWGGKHERNRNQQEAVGYALLAKREGLYRKLAPAQALHVLITRLAPGKLDSDNLAGSQKHVRDAVAKFLGIDDGDESKATWSYGQERSKTYAVRIEFYRRTG